MTIRLKTLASGSSGNATFLRFGNTRLLLDAGISYSRIQEGMESMGESIDELAAVVITHEHTDHIKGLEQLRKHHENLAIYATAGTARDFSAETVEIVKAGRKFSFGDLEIHPFRTSHDAREPVGFRFEIPGFALAVATDLGQVTRDVLAALKGCNVLMVEANYDRRMLQWSPYPAFLKRRISGRGGHLSNDQCGELIRRVLHPGLESVILVHLSEKNNSPEQATAVVTEALSGREICLRAAPRGGPGPLLSFRPAPVDIPPEKQQILPF